MKRWLWFGLFIFLISFTGVKACSPMPYWEVTVELTDCDQQLLDDIALDVLVYKDDVSMNDEVLLSYRSTFPSYQDFTFLDDGTFVSYRAYVENETDSWYCTLHVELSSEIEEYKIVLFDPSDGTIIFESDLLQGSDVSYDGDKHDFRYWGYSVEDDLLTVESISDGCYDFGVQQAWIIGISFVIIGVFIILLLVVVNYFILRAFHAEFHKKGYMITLPILGLLIGGAFIFEIIWLVYLLSVLLFFVTFLIHYLQDDELEIKELLVLFIINLVIPVLIFVWFI